MRILVTGASGLIGSYVLRELAKGTDEVTAWTGSTAGERFGCVLHPIDLACLGEGTEKLSEVLAGLHQARPDAILHLGAMARIADCHHDPERAQDVNEGGTAVLAALAYACKIRLVYVSTDLVFDGQNAPYREEHRPDPLSCYGRTKVVGERAVEHVAKGLVVRLSLVFGPSLSDRPAFFDQQLSALRHGRPVSLFEDEWRTPLAGITAAQALVALARSDITGILHLGGPARLSRYEMGLQLARHIKADERLVTPVSRLSLTDPEPRPRDVSLDSSKWRSLFPELPWPGFAEALEMGAAEIPWRISRCQP